MPTFKIPRLGKPSVPARPEVATVYVEEARKRLKEGKTDTDALFTLAAWHAVHGENQKSLALLHRLTQLEPTYPGVWRFQAPRYPGPRGGEKAGLGGGAAGGPQERGGEIGTPGGFWFPITSGKQPRGGFLFHAARPG